MMEKNYQEPTLEIERLYCADILTESGEGDAPKLDDGIGDFYEQEF